MESLANVYLNELMLYNQEETSIALANPSSDDDASQTRMPPARPQTRHTIEQQDYRARLDEQFHSLRETLRRVLCECETEKLWSAADPTKAQIVDAASGLNGWRAPWSDTTPLHGKGWSGGEVLLQWCGVEWSD
jgi:hypothetical protein